MLVATLGPQGTFSHEAVKKLFGNHVEIDFRSAISQVFSGVQYGKNVAKGVVPLENSTTGGISVTLDLLKRASLFVIQELTIPIRYRLAAHSTDYRDIKLIYAHPEAASQCQCSLDVFFPTSEIISTSSNARSAELLKSDVRICSAALIPEFAAEIYNLTIIFDRDMQNLNENNYTRFIVISKERTAKTGNDKTSLVVTPKVNRTGILCDILGVFKERDLDLTKIESRPNGKIGEYIFFIDCAGHWEDKFVRGTIDFLKANGLADVKFLGSYPRSC